MPDLAWPWMLLAVPAPLLVAWWLRPAEPGGAALRMPALADWRASGGQGRRISQVSLGFWLLWLLLCLAAARPQWLGEPLAPPRPARDLMLAIDLSGSMAEDDMRLAGRRIDRLSAAKAVLRDFLERRRGDRVGLIVFGRQAYPLVPLTFDVASVDAQLADLTVGMAGRETAIGDAVALAVKRLRERPRSQRVLVLLTDGVNTAGVLGPERALELAQAEGVRIHSIGFGSDPRVDPLAALLPVADGIDEQSLRTLADGTGGRYFRATDTRELAGIYQTIDRIEPIEAEGQPVRPRHELYVWPLAAALMYWLLAALVIRLRGLTT